MFGGDDETGGIFIQPVNDARPPFAAHTFQIGTVGQQRIHQRAVGVAQRRMNDHARRLVDDDKVAVPVADVQRNVLGHHFRLDDLRDASYQGLATAMR